ncbi:type II toxin-antitoxin system HicA family toxin [Candidatus Poriferisodalis sp.]|uniref:type II toxin-antitoxin system HicA family toxin n=1 Tax=Candidatus Poriferisodalis sp. TaxID=3101277 RepID=UPI003B027A80
MPTVRQAIRIITADGWRLKNIRGSHRQFVHPSRPGKVTIAGHFGDEVSPGTWKSILRQAGIGGRPTA